jgi:hypothetical protein
MASKDRLVPDVRINFQLHRAEHPLLTDELLKSRKGRPRHSRLASLAYLGLLAEKRLMHAPPVEHTASRKDSEAADHSKHYMFQLSPEDLGEVFRE